MKLDNAAIKSMVSNPLSILSNLEVDLSEAKFLSSVINTLSPFNKQADKVINHSLEDIILGVKGLVDKVDDALCARSTTNQLYDICEIITEVLPSVKPIIEDCIVNLTVNGKIKPSIFTELIIFDAKYNDSISNVIYKELYAIPEIKNTYSQDVVYVLSEAITGYLNMIKEFIFTIASDNKPTKTKQVKGSKKMSKKENQKTEEITLNAKGGNAMNTEENKSDVEMIQAISETFKTISTDKNETSETKDKYEEETITMDAKKNDREVSEMIDEVNELDKMIMDIGEDAPEISIEDRITALKIYLSSIICTINNLDKEKYIGDGSLIDNIDFNDSECRNDSRIFNDKEIAVKLPVNSKMFKVRYLSLLLASIVKNFDDIMEANTKETDSEYLTNFTRLVVDLSINILKNKSYGDSLNKVLCTLWKADSNKELDDMIELYNEYLSRVNDGAKHKLLTNKTTKALEETENAELICQLAYTAVNGNDYCGTKTLDTDNFSMKDKESISVLVSSLGEMIKERREDNVLFKGYTMFSNCNPEIFTKLVNINKDNSVNVGLYAIVYLSFISDNKNINKAISKMNIA